MLKLVIHILIIKLRNKYLRLYSYHLIVDGFDDSKYLSEFFRLSRSVTYKYLLRFRYNILHVNFNKVL